MARNRAGNLGADIVRLRSVEWYVCEKCLASEYSLHLGKSFEGCLHNIISGPCLPERNNIELCWYLPSFYERGYTAELFDGALEWQRVDVHQGYTIGGLQRQALGRLES